MARLDRMPEPMRSHSLKGDGVDAVLLVPV